MYMADSVNGAQPNNGAGAEAEVAQAATDDGANADPEIDGTSANGGAGGPTTNNLGAYTATLNAMNALLTTEITPENQAALNTEIIKHKEDTVRLQK